jgi:hypothetical protein
MSESTNPPQASAASTSKADADHSGDDTMPDEATVGGISDDQLPEDLKPGEDNPLAEPLDPEAEDTKSPEELGMDETQPDMSPYSDMEQDSDQQAGGGSGADDEG